MQLQRERSFYERYIKRVLDIICSLLALVFLSWLYLIIAVAVKMKMGSPVVFHQPRPGMIDDSTGKERIFDMYKFRTMTDARDENGDLKPDEERLTAFGKMLRATSLDELPEALNILKGDMSIIGPRPQLVRDMVFMSDEIRMRHTAKPGLSGLAQVMGRNAITWEEKFNWDLKYIENISFLNDLKILALTAKKVLGHEESSAELDVADDYGYALLKSGKVSKETFDCLNMQAVELIKEHYAKRGI